MKSAKSWISAYSTKYSDSMTKQSSNWASSAGSGAASLRSPLSRRLGHPISLNVQFPRHDASEPLHVRLSELGETAEQECEAIIANSDIPNQPAGDAQSRAARKLLRHEWQPNSKVAQDIEATVAQLLSDPAQAALAERQMDSK